MMERIASATVHGRYLVEAPEEPGPAPMLVGFHGYAEDAEIQMERLLALAAGGRWLCVSIQGLHPFYRRATGETVANWMTTLHREMAIADNIVYVKTCLDTVASEWQVMPGPVFAGFSQGVAMAYRAAVHSRIPAAGVIAVGGDIPPEIQAQELEGIGAVTILRGKTDDWYTKEKFESDVLRLQTANLPFRATEFEAGHVWSPEMTAVGSEFLRQLRP